MQKNVHDVLIVEIKLVWQHNFQRLLSRNHHLREITSIRGHVGYFKLGTYFQITLHGLWRAVIATALTFMPCLRYWLFGGFADTG